MQSCRKLFRQPPALNGSAWGPASDPRLMSLVELLCPSGGLSLFSVRPRMRSVPLVFDVGVPSGLGTEPGIPVPGLIGACSGSQSQIDEQRMSTRRSVWSRRTHGESEGPKRWLSDHLTLGCGVLNLGGGALRCSDPMGPRGTQMYLCP